jgi:hypothetical protein
MDSELITKDQVKAALMSGDIKLFRSLSIQYFRQAYKKPTPALVEPQDPIFQAALEIFAP